MTVVQGKNVRNSFSLGEGRGLFLSKVKNYRKVVASWTLREKQEQEEEKQEEGKKKGRERQRESEREESAKGRGGKDPSVCTSKTSPCAPAKRPHVEHVRAF